MDYWALGGQSNHRKNNTTKYSDQTETQVLGENVYCIIQNANMDKNSIDAGDKRELCLTDRK